MRTTGLVRFEIASYRDLGLAGVDSLDLLSNGELDGATVYSPYVSGQIPEHGIQELWGKYSSGRESFEGSAAVIGDLDPLASDESGGGAILNHSWYFGADPFLFCREPIRSTGELLGKIVRSLSGSFSDWLRGMGATAQPLSRSEVYTALERGLVDCGVTGADAAHDQRWYEVTENLTGPLYSTFVSNNVISRDTWDRIPVDLQQIILEEAAKSELESLRLGAVQNEVGIQRNIDAGLDYIPFSNEVQELSRTAAIDQVIPNWTHQLGSANDPVVTDTFNNKLGPIVGMWIESNGTVTDLR